MRKVVLRAGLGAAVLAVICSFGYFRASGQEKGAADPMFGTWKMDVAKSVNNRGGNHQIYTYQATRTLTAKDDGFVMTLSTGSPAAQPVSYFGKFDGKDYPDTRSRAGDETLAHWRINPEMIVRLKKTKSVPSEWVVYTISNDGAIFTSTSWVPTNPELEDLQVFTRGK